MVAAKTWKRLWWKGVKSRRGGQGMLLITLKLLIMMTQATKHFSQATKQWGKKMFCSLRHHYQNVINSIPAQTLAAFFWFYTFLSQLFSGLGCNLFTARVFLVGIYFIASGTDAQTHTYYTKIKNPDVHQSQYAPGSKANTIFAHVTPITLHQLWVFMVLSMLV